jgi:hypothetical protein
MPAWYAKPVLLPVLAPDFLVFVRARSRLISEPVVSPGFMRPLISDPLLTDYYSRSSAAVRSKPLKDP